MLILHQEKERNNMPGAKFTNFLILYKNFYDFLLQRVLPGDKLKKE